MLRRAPIFAFFIFALLSTFPARADVKDPLDPFDSMNQSQEPNTENDDDKSASELLIDATQLFSEGRPLDARTKLLKALAKDPKKYQVHMMLSGYYIEHVGHFRLALRYAKQAEALLLEQNKGSGPPFHDYITESEHKQILYLLIQARLNLDNYQGALDTLDEFSQKYHYMDDWYPDTRAWVLMKLGRVEEAIKLTRAAVWDGIDGGRSLNMLGILLSMHDERQQSIGVFKKAIEYELSLGREGEPATPLNNLGEVYKETFQDSNAESSWLKATSLPDGCEHVLPSLNLALIYIEQLNFRGAKQAMDNFEACVAQYPLRNGEEHRAFVKFARGRIDLHTGFADSAIKRLQEAIEQQQWFGKIGTEPEELQASAFISLSQALTAKRNQMKFYHFKSIGEHLSWLEEDAVDAVRAWWLMRRARQITAEDLKDLDDIEIRHTDSMMEYPTMGEAMVGFPEALLRKRIQEQSDIDSTDRKGALPYYKEYLAESLLANGSRDEAFNLLKEVVQTARPQFDAGLVEQAKTRLLSYYQPDSKAYQQLAEDIYTANRAQLRNYGFRLPVNFVTDNPNSPIIDRMGDSAFYPDNDGTHEFTVRDTFADGQHSLSFESKNNRIGLIKVSGNDLDEVVNRFTDEVFSEDLGDREDESKSPTR